MLGVIRELWAFMRERKKLWLAPIIVILVLVVMLVLMWLRQRKTKQASDEIETTILRQADVDIQRSTPGQAAELENLKAELLARIKALRGSKRGQGNSARFAFASAATRPSPTTVPTSTPSRG